jgi:hypothetical protein
MAVNLAKNVKVTRVMNGQTAGTGDTLTGSTLDMANYDGVLFIGAFGTITATAVTTLKAQQGAASNMSDAADLEGTAISIADTDDNKVALLDIFRPAERYVRAIITRETANAVVDGVIAVQYSGRVKPITQGSTVASTETHVSPEEGTA